MPGGNSKNQRRGDEILKEMLVFKLDTGTDRKINLN
jgi:hypothetical protein